MEVVNLDDPIVFVNEVDSLYNLALLSVQFSLLQFSVVTQRLTGGKRYTTSPSDTISSALPETIKRAINSSSYWGLEEVLTKWWNYHNERVFFDHRARFGWIDLSEHIVWVSSESINYKVTAQRMLACLKLTSVQKFRMAALYCLDDQIESLWRNLTEAEIAALTAEMSSSTRPQHFVIRYWFTKFSGVGNVRKQNSSIPAMLQKTIDFGKSPLWCTIEYFFDHLEVAKRPSAVERILYNRPKFRIHLLSKLTGAELNEVLRKGEFMFLRVAEIPRNEKYTMAIWKRMLPLIEEKTVLSIFTSTLDISLLSHDYCMEYDYQIRLSFQMWSCLNEELKTKMARTYPHKLIIPPKLSDWGQRNIFFDLIIDVLARNDLEYRSQYWTQYWDRFTNDFQQKEAVEKIMSLCFPNRAAVETFKRDVLCDYSVIKPYCERLLEKESLDKLQAFLEVCSSDRAVVSSLKKHIFAIPRAPQFIYLHLSDSRFLPKFTGEVSAFDKLIEGAFDDEIAEKSFKDLLVTTPENLSKLQVSLQAGLFEYVSSFVDQYLSSETEKARVKSEFIECFRRAMLNCWISYSFMKAEKWDHFAMWLFNDDAAQMAQFKSSISAEIENILAIKVPRIVQDLSTFYFHYEIDQKNVAPKRRRVSKSLNASQIGDKVYKDNFEMFDRMLLWILGTRENLARVKSNIINRRAEFEYLTQCLKNKDKRIVDAVIDFFFDRDVQRKEHFKKEFKRKQETVQTETARAESGPVSYTLFFQT